MSVQYSNPKEEKNKNKGYLGTPGDTPIREHISETERGEYLGIPLVPIYMHLHFHSTLALLLLLLPLIIQLSSLSPFSLGVKEYLVYYYISLPSAFTFISFVTLSLVYMHIPYYIF